VSQSVLTKVLLKCTPAIIGIERNLLKSHVFREAGNDQLKYREGKKPILYIKLPRPAFVHLVDLAVVNTNYGCHSFLVASKNADLAENCAGPMILPSSGIFIVPLTR